MTVAASKIREWRNNANLFVREVFQAEPDAWQEEMLTEASKPGRVRIAMKSCAGPGKTAGEAWVGWHRLLCFADKGEHPKGSAVSITQDNLRTNLWPEMAKWRARSPLLMSAFQWTAERIYAIHHPETWFLDAKAYAKGADPETIGRTLSGQHSKYVFYLIDESGDMPPQIERAAEQGLTTCEDGLIITAGNTTSHNGLLYKACSEGKFYVISITADPDDPKRTPRVNAEWAREQIELHGRDNPWVMAYILGQFPPGSLNTLLTLEEVEAAMKRHYHEDEYAWSQKRLGIDVARFGDDRTVLFLRQGLQAGWEPVILRHQRTTDIAARAAQMKAEHDTEMEFVDDTGHWGHGVIDNLFAAGFTPQGVQFHGPPIDPRYKNRRAEMWIEMAQWVKRGGALPKIPALIEELTAPTYTMNLGKLQLEDKDQVKKRLNRSPDLADALALTFALPDQPSMRDILPNRFMSPAGRVNDEYDLFGD